MHKKKRWAALAVSACLSISLLLGGCSSLDMDFAGSSNTESQKDDSITDQGTADDVFSLNYDPEYGLNPILSTSVENRKLIPLIYDSMIQLDGSFQPVPGLFTDWSSEDGINWVFHLAEGHSFHDGNAITANDAMQTLQRAATGGAYAARLTGIVQMSAPEQNTLEVTLGAADYLFPTRLGNIPVLEAGTTEADNPVGSGMYQVEWGDTPKLTVYAGYPGGDALALDTIYLKSYDSVAALLSGYEDGLVDLVCNDPLGTDGLGYSSSNEFRAVDTTNMHYLGFNAQHAFGSSAACRSALVCAMDREMVVKDALGSNASPTVLPVNPACAWYNSELASKYACDAAAARKALKKAGVEDFDEDGQLEMEITGVETELSLDFIVCSDSASKVSAARVVRQCLETLGFTVELRELSWEEYCTALEEGDFDLYYGEVKLTPDFDISSLVGGGGSLNYGKISDASFGTYVEALRSAPEGERQEKADAYFQYLLDSAPILPICFEKQQVISHRGVISGLDPVVDNVFYHFSDWKVKLKAK